MAQRGQLPVEQRNCTRRVVVEDQVIEPEVAVHQRHAAVFFGNIVGQPRHQLFHWCDALHFRSAILARPALVLPLKIIAGLAVVGEPGCFDVNAVKGCKDPVHFVINCSALHLFDARYRGVPEDPSVAVLHDIEQGADQVAIVAEVKHARHRHIGVLQRGQHTKFPVNGMRRLEQLSGWLAP